MIAHGIDLDSNAIRDFCRKWKIRELSVFGSILRDDFRPDSDIDLLVDYEIDAEWDLFDRFDMEDDLAGIVGRNPALGCTTESESKMLSSTTDVFLEPAKRS